MLYIGVDLGTSAVKLLLMDENGKIKNIVSKEYPLSFPNPGWSEQNPKDWFEKSMEGIREFTKDCDKSQVQAAGLKPRELLSGTSARRIHSRLPLPVSTLCVPRNSFR